MGVFGVDVLQRFERSHIPEPMSGCWLWLENQHSVSGHGRFSYDSKTEYAHRVSYEMHKGAVTGDVVRHTCDTPSCVNPDHLTTGTRADNMHDMYRRGRSYAQNQTHCKQGHEFTEENTKLTIRQRICLTCKRVTDREYRRRKRAS